MMNFGTIITNLAYAESYLKYKVDESDLKHFFISKELDLDEVDTRTLRAVLEEYKKIRIIN